MNNLKLNAYIVMIPDDDFYFFLHFLTRLEERKQQTEGLWEKDHEDSSGM
jgi:hypothetical protein